MIKKTLKLIVIINLVGFSHNIFTNYLEVFNAFTKENVEFQKINEINHKPWIIMEKCCKIRSCHFTCVAGMVQSCNHVAAALYRIEAVVKNG